MVLSNPNLSKPLFVRKGFHSDWDRFGNISAAINHIQKIKVQVSHSMHAAYQGSTHTPPKADTLIWRVTDKVKELGLQKKNGESRRG